MVPPGDAIPMNIADPLALPQLPPPAIMPEFVAPRVLRNDALDVVAVGQFLNPIPMLYFCIQHVTFALISVLQDFLRRP